MFIVLVITVIAAFADAGYPINTPNTSPALPDDQLVQQIAHVNGNLQPDVTLTTIHQPEHSVSYAISHADYEYLKQQKQYAHAPYPYNQPLATQLDNFHGNTHINTINDALIGSSVGDQEQISNVAAKHGNIDTYQENVGTYQANVPIVNPVVTKHVYFHVPPPDVEEPPLVVRAPPPKKVYKIIFIKVPSQESPLNIASLQQALQSQQAPVQDKTLIYVLSKKEEPQQQVVVPKPTIFNHEVFFVKYGGDANNVAAQINDELALADLQNGLPVLQPGLANGRPS